MFLAVWYFFVLFGAAVGQSIGKKPNIVLIVSDDQDVTLKGLIPMTATQSLLGLKGVTFLNAFTSSPICCPSRASILSGMYAHNHATTNNSANGGCYGDFWQEKVEPKALPVVLQQNGYETFFAGKYLNLYKTKTVPPGWDKFFGLHGNARYYNYTMTENGELVSYGDKYLTDVLAEKALAFLRGRDTKQPFFAMITPPAPHAPYTPADRHNSSFEGVRALRTRSFNHISGILEKHWLVQTGKRIPESVLVTIDSYYRKRWQSLLAVDELVQSVVKQLEENGDLDDTYVVYTSDNGYHLGQFAQPFDKRQPYETDIRVPMLVRGPNLPLKAVSNIPVALIDLFPTFLEWAGIALPDDLDGISFNSHISGNRVSMEMDKNFHRQILIEHWGEGNEATYNPACPWKPSDNLAQCTPDADCHCQDSWNNTYACVRHFAYRTNKIYCEFKDEENFVEAYDLSEDPDQIENLGYEMLPSERAMYSIALQNLTECIGETCRETRF